MQVTAAEQVQSAIVVDGFAVLEGVLSSDSIDKLLTALAHVDESESVRKRGGVFAVRSLLETCPEIVELAGSDEVRACVESVLGPEFFPVRGTLFDKIPGANWKVPWHQDLTIAVAERIEVAGWGPWSVKAGIQHVQPPAEIFEKMLTVRLHLDACGENNGALHVLPGSHRRGRIPEEGIAALRESGLPQVCAVGRGGALLMRPLLLHASFPARVPGHRRVVHLDFAAAPLPGGLRWSTQVPP